MWPLHSRTRPLGHSFTSESRRALPRVAVALADADADADALGHSFTSESRRALPRVTVALAADADVPPSPASPSPQPVAVSARRRKWQRRLSSKSFHIVILGLVLLDLCTIVVDLVLVLTHSEYRPTRSVEEASRALTAASLAILSLFVLEFCAAAAVFGPRVWFGEPLHFFDVCVVVASLSLEAALFHLERTDGAGFEGLAALLVVGRLWRLARVAYTASEASEAVQEVREDGESSSAREIAALRQEVAALRAQLAEAGVAQRLLPATPSEPAAAAGVAQRLLPATPSEPAAAAASARREGEKKTRRVESEL